MKHAKNSSAQFKTQWTSPRKWAVCGGLLAGIIMASGVNAQVHRCKDSSGQLMFSDRPCSSGQAGGLIEARKSDRAIYEERVRAFEAEAKKQDRYAAERENELRRQSSQSQYPLPMQSQRKGFAERLAERNSAVQSNLIPSPGRPQGNQRYEPPEVLPVLPPKSPSMNGRIECSYGVCKDRSGNRYEPDGFGNFKDKTTGNRCKPNGFCF